MAKRVLRVIQILWICGAVLGLSLILLYQAVHSGESGILGGLLVFAISLPTSALVLVAVDTAPGVLGQYYLGETLTFASGWLQWFVLPWAIRKARAASHERAVRASWKDD